MTLRVIHRKSAGSGSHSNRRLIDIQHAQYTVYALDNEPIGDAPEWRMDDMKFFVISRNDADLITASEGYEAHRVRSGPDRVLRCLREFGEIEFSDEPEVSAA